MKIFGKGKEMDLLGKDERISYLSQWLVCSSALVLHIGFLILFNVYSVDELFIFNIGSVSVYICLLVYLLLCTPQKRDYATAVAAAEILLHQTLCMQILGLSFGFQQFLLPTAAYTFLCTTKSKKAYIINTVIAAISVFVYAGSGIVFKTTGQKYDFPERMASIMYGAFSVAAFAMLLLVVWLMSYQRNQNYKNAMQKNAELEHMMKMRSLFLANMSHEVRTPLNVMVGMVGLTLKGELQEQARENLEYVHSAGESLLETLSDILDLSNMESGRTSLNERAYSPRGVMEELGALSRVAAEEKQLQLHMRIADDLPDTLCGDVDRIRQVLHNLLSNAVKFTEKGSVTFAVSASVENEVCNLFCEVRDTGVGIRKDDTDRIFNMFEQADAGQNGNVDGIGLGLAISKRLVDLMGGTLGVDSVYGKGSSFLLKLPQKIISDAS